MLASLVSSVAENIIVVFPRLCVLVLNWITTMMWSFYEWMLPFHARRSNYRYYARRRCLVTGGASGTGLKLVRQLLEMDAVVFVIDTSPKELEELKLLVKNSPLYSSDQLQTLAIDLTAPGSALRAIDSALQFLGRIDSFFNQAHIPYVGSFATATSPSLQKVMRINLQSSILLTHSLLEKLALLEDKAPLSVDLHYAYSSAADMALPYLSAYAATQAGLRQFVQSLSRELIFDPNQYPFDLRISSVVPSFVATADLSQDEEYSSLYQWFAWPPAKIAETMLSSARLGRSSYMSFFESCVSWENALFPLFYDWIVALVLEPHSFSTSSTKTK